MIRTIVLLAAVLSLAFLVLEPSPALPPPTPDRASVVAETAEVPTAPVPFLPPVGSGTPTRVFLIREDASKIAPAPPAVVEASDTKIRLIGIARWPSGGTALFAVETSPDVQRRKVGERIDTWTIIAMEARSVTLASGARRQILRLDTP